MDGLSQNCDIVGDASPPPKPFSTMRVFGRIMAMYAKGQLIVVTRCPLCETRLGYFFRGYMIYFQASCDCQALEPEQRTYGEFIRLINSRPEWARSLIDG